MKKIISASFFLIFLISCSKNSNEASLASCINVDKENIEVGEIVIFSNCSNNYTSFEYKYFDILKNEEVISTESIIELSYSKPGNYTVSLTVFDDNGTADTSSKTITVNEFTDKLFLINTPDNYQSVPLSAGIDETTGNLYYIDLYGSATGDKNYYYRELDSDYKEISNTLLRRQTENGGSAFILSLPNGDKTITMINTFSDSYFSRQITINSTGNTWTDFTGIDVIYGNLDSNENRIFFGSDSEYDSNEQRFKNYPAIEIRDANNAIIETKTYTDLEFKNSIISDMIALDNGYVALGGAFENEGNGLNNYTPLLIFFNSNLEITEIKKYTNTQLVSSDIFISYDNLNLFMHIEKLSSGKLVTYGLGELRIMDSNGEELFSTLTLDYASSGSIINLGDSFIISKRGYLTKYNESGNIIKEIYTNGDITSNLTLVENNIVFVSAFQSSGSNNIGILKPFIGAVDTNLNFIDLNN